MGRVLPGASNGQIQEVMKRARSRLCCRLRWFALLTVAGGVLVSCDTPVGVSPALKGTYWEHALVTNPYGGGPMVVRWGPPENRIPSGHP